ncbi:hypothetical protein BDQ12DRAFT_690688 [Crucibulum laeve]|uniref:HMG box domain-containing protein n=1 Tax=Crucibulum laeve TaxID=68775 RepID=A0A5C3LKU3_9AGAR|nr:hypothetical protein BDQ12DRAFT_690688 [Crucibulum laeve]
MQINHFPDIDYSTSPPPPLPHRISSADSGDAFHLSFKSERRDERASLSGSEDGNYLFSEAVKNEIDQEEESNSALTSQTLNADGTPKRPMNAFMIFARRRRPQVSAENQSMRTGEISKILSKEWTTMQPTEKQFYLDQAKQLKDTFNTKYPDYVYRRRPNNSRKRRRADGSIRTGDNPLPADVGDDMAGNPDFGESSPIDGEDESREIPYARPLPDIPQSYLDQGKFGSQARSSSYSYTSDPAAFRSMTDRLPFPNNDRLNNILPPPTGLTPQPLQFSYMPPQNHAPSSMYNEQVEQHDTWQPRVERAPAGWPGPSKSSAYASTTQNSWPATTTSISASSNATTSSSAPPYYPFPTLNTPFIPANAQVQGYPSSSSSNSQTDSPPDQHFNTSGPLSGREAYDDRAGYAHSPSLSPVSPYPNSSRDPLGYGQRPSSFSRGLPPVQSLSGYSQPTLQPGTPGSLSSSASQTYWGREKMDGY